MPEPAPWTYVYVRLKAEVPGATDAQIRAQVWATALDFTQDTNLWQETVPLNIEPNVLEYPFTVEHGYPNRLMLVYDPAVTGYKKWADQSISMRIPGTVELTRTPSEAVLWNAVVAKQVSDPLLDSSGKSTDWPYIDSWIVDKNFDVFYYGALGFLYRQPAKTYSNPKSAVENGRIYASQKANARVNDQRMNTFDGQAWTFPQGWATVRRKGWA
jgi:hypothetical protein